MKVTIEISDEQARTFAQAGLHGATIDKLIIEAIKDAQQKAKKEELGLPWKACKPARNPAIQAASGGVSYFDNEARRDLALSAPNLADRLRATTELLDRVGATHCDNAAKVVVCLAKNDELLKKLGWG